MMTVVFFFPEGVNRELKILFFGDLQSFWKNNSYEAAPLESGDKNGFNMGPLINVRDIYGQHKRFKHKAPHSYDL